MALVYMVLVMILIFSLEAASFEGSSSSSTSSGPGGSQTAPRFEIQTVEVLNEMGQTTEGGYSETGFTLTQAAIEHVFLKLTWSDDLGNNDVFRITLMFKGQVLKSQEGSSGVIDLDISTLDMDEPQGDYAVSIEAVDCPGAVEGVPVDRDSGNDWNLVVSARLSVEITGE